MALLTVDEPEDVISVERMIAKIYKQQWFAEFNLGDHALLRTPGSPSRKSTEVAKG